MVGIAGMAETAMRNVRAFRVLDSIVRPKLKSNPALLQVWKAVTKIERPPKRAKETTATTSATGSGSGSSPAGAGLAAG